MVGVSLRSPHRRGILPDDRGRGDAWFTGWGSDATVVTANTGSLHVVGQTPRAAHPKLMFATVGLALLMSALDSTIVATALPTLERDLRASVTWAGWTVTAYALGLMLMLMLSGRLSERYGRRRVFLASVAVFTLASLACALAGNIYVLLALRFIQALGGAGFTPSATGIIVDHFGDGRDKAVGLFGTIFPIGGMAGPVLGGLFVQYWSWRAIFMVNVPIGALLTVMCLLFVPRDTGPADRTGRVDLVGAGLLGGGALGVMLAVSLVGQNVDAVASPWFAVCAVIGVLCLTVFWHHIGHSAHPIVPRRFITGVGFGAVNAINVIYNGMINAVVVLVPLYAATRFGLPALQAGTVLTAEAAAAIVISPMAVAALRRTGYRLPVLVGGAIMAIGSAGLAIVPGGVSAYAWLAAAGCVIGIGAGVVSPASRNAGLQLEPDRSSSLAALRTMGTQVGLIATVSGITAVVTLASDPAGAQALLYLICAAVFVCALPLTARVPEHHGAW